MSVTITKPVTLKDTLNHLAPGASDGDSAHARGVLVGVVGALMATGLSWAAAIKVASDHAPRRVIADSVPPSWLKDFAVIGPVSNANEWVRSTGTGD